MLSFPECVTWLAVGLTESVAIVTLNIITIIVFIKNRNLRKRSTYLIINLAVVDMLAGGITTHDLFYLEGVSCNFWKYNFPEGWPGYVLHTLLVLFHICSIINITAISVERLHATLRPFRHRTIKQFVYGIVVAVVWVAAGLLSISLTTVIRELKAPKYAIYLWSSFFFVCLLVICVSYSSIVIKVRCGAQPQHHGAASRERKLTMTLLNVTVVSVLLYLPTIVFQFLLWTIEFEIESSMSDSSFHHLYGAVIVLFCANSLVNPILYAIRIPEYRSAILALFRRRPQQQRQAAVLPLHNL